MSEITLEVDTTPEPTVLIQEPTLEGAGDSNEPTRLETGEMPDKNKESVTEISLPTPAFAFRGKFPDVPFAKGVNIAELTKGDPGEPLYVVRPLAVLGGVSDNNLEYDKELINEIYQQVLSKKPPARQGHTPKENASWEFPNDVGLWVGAEMVGNTLYGKAYIYPNTQFHQMVIKRKAAGSTLSNSIEGIGNWYIKPNGNKGLRGLELESIVFAPAERASLQALGGEFGTTSEMTNNLEKREVIEMANEADDKAQDLALIRSEIAKHVKEMAPSALHEMMTKDQRQHCAEMHVREMEPSSVYEMMPAPTRKHISECYVKEFGAKEPAAEMTATLALKQQVTEMATENASMKASIAEFKQEKFDNNLDSAVAGRFSSWQVRGDTGLKAIASAKANLTMFVVAEMAAMDGGQKLENIPDAVERAWGKYEPQAALLRTALSGGNVITGTQVSEQRQGNYGYDPKTGRYSDEAAAQARGSVAPH